MQFAAISLLNYFKLVDRILKWYKSRNPWIMSYIASNTIFIYWQRIFLVFLLSCNYFYCFNDWSIWHKRRWRNLV